MGILRILSNGLKVLQSRGTYTVIMEFSVLAALIKYLVSNNNKRSSKEHKIYKQLVLQIEPMFQDLDDDKNHIRTKHEAAYKMYMINDISSKFHISKKKIKIEINSTELIKNILRLDAQEYAYRRALSELEIMADTLNHKKILRHLISKHPIRQIYEEIFTSHRELFYNKYSKKNYLESRKLNNIWK